MLKVFGIALVGALLSCPVAAQAQSAIPRSERNVPDGGGDRVGGRVVGSGVVGGGVVAGGVVGGVTGLLDVDQVSRFRDYVVREGRSAYRVDQEVRRGMILPGNAIVFRDIPPGFGISPRYQYTVVNDHIVIVYPRTRQVVQVVD